MNSNNLHILFPGKFKPVHDGHIYMIAKALAEHNVDVTVIISAKSVDGLSAEVSRDFLETVFGTCRNFQCVISDQKTPIIDAYNIVAMKKYGDGTYTLISSGKDHIDRSAEFSKSFSPGGKYHTPGADVITYSVNNSAPFTYVHGTRDDVDYDTPVSSTIVRKDIASNDWSKFKTSYTRSLNAGIISEKELASYFGKLSTDMHKAGDFADIPSEINEGGAAGHMKHPHEFSDMTFGEIRDFVRDLLTGKVTDITEKLDGINLLASIDEKGNVIFARNQTHLKGHPLSYSDLISECKWDDNIKSAFIKGANCISDVISNIPSKARVFFMSDQSSDNDGSMWCDWINFEILDPSAKNVIPYAESLISIHNIVTVIYQPGRGRDGWEIRHNQKISEEKLSMINDAIQKTDRSKFGAILTPTLVISSGVESDCVGKEIDGDIVDIMDNYNLDNTSTIYDYKEMRIINEIMYNDQVMCDIDDHAKKLIASYWLGNGSTTAFDVKKTVDKDTYKYLSDFKAKKLPAALKDISRPINNIFVSLGAEALKHVKGLRNSNVETRATKEIRTRLLDVISAAESSSDEKLKGDIEFLLSRLSDFDIPSSEGIVVGYRGKVFKLTGIFPVINTLFNQMKSLKK